MRAAPHTIAWILTIFIFAAIGLALGVYSAYQTRAVEQQHFFAMWGCIIGGLVIGGLVGRWLVGPRRPISN